jgi:hypothetical protein
VGDVRSTRLDGYRDVEAHRPSMSTTLDDEDDRRQALMLPALEVAPVAAR